MYGCTVPIYLGALASFIEQYLQECIPIFTASAQNLYIAYVTRTVDTEYSAQITFIYIYIH